MTGWRVGVDTGGSFTDLFAREQDTGEVRVVKVPSQPEAPAGAVIGALDAFLATGVRAREIRTLAHGTTVATNALLEGKGVRAGLLITAGFRAVYEARGWMRPESFDVIDPAFGKPPMLVPQRLTEEIAERVDFRGRVLRRLDEEEVRAAVRRLLAKGVESIAVCYLFSFLAPGHEERTARVIAEESPGLRVSLSSRVLPTIREYPRLSTTVVDARIGPVVASYLTELGERLRARELRTPRIFLMQSHGGLMHLGAAAGLPTNTLLSGPAAGVVAGIELARAAGVAHAVTFDMGGTSTDIAVVSDGRVQCSDEGRIAGQDVATAMLDIRTLGAGGGSLVWIGEDGLLKVGPQSAGADPGPACYARGGQRPTVTDAHVVLGSLGPGGLIGGGLRLHPRLAHAAMQRVAAPLGLEVAHAAWGVLRILDNAMASQLRLALQREGRDPRRFTLVAFGGAGPLHAARLARLLHLPRVLVPRHPGAASAAGLLGAPLRYAAVASQVGLLAAFEPARMNAIFSALESRVLAHLAECGHRAKIRRQLDLRYRHQGFQLAVDVPPGEVTADAKQALKRAFDDVHHRLYAHHAPHEEAEVVTFRLTGQVEAPALEAPILPGGAGDPSRAVVGTRAVYDPQHREFREAAVYERSRLATMDCLSGPAVVEQLDATTLVPAGQHARVDRHGNLLIQVTPR